MERQLYVHFFINFWLRAEYAYTSKNFVAPREWL